MQYNTDIYIAVNINKNERNTVREEIIAGRYFSRIYFRDFAPKSRKLRFDSEDKFCEMNHLVVNREK